MGGKIDLHCHTNYSDGVLSPSELLLRARDVEIGTISITDHDTIDGVKEAINIGKLLNICVIPGVEFSATYNNCEIHIIGYFIDIDNEQLLYHIELLKRARLKRAEVIVHKLNKMNIPLKFEYVLDIAGKGAVGRPHIATALLNEGFVDSFENAFDIYLGQGRPAYEKKIEYSPDEIISIISEAGGLSFLAHPRNSLNDVDLYRIVNNSIDGIEVIHPSHTPELVQFYRGIANEYYLLQSGGSDFHGGARGDDDKLGTFTIPPSMVEDMKIHLYPRNK